MNKYLCDHITRTIDIKTHKEEGVFSGYASVFSVVDHHGDEIMPGAFTKTLQKIRKTRVYPKMLWHHDTRFPIGIWTHIEEDHHGLKVEGKLLLDIQQGRETYALMKAGVLDGLSIGFRPIKARKKPGGRFLDEVDLYEISLVTFASNPEARIVDLKSEDLSDAGVNDLLQRLDTLGEMLRS